MSPLERLGLEVAAYTLLGSRSSAAALMVLVEANGAPLHWRAIDAARAWKMRREPTEQMGAVKTRICLLRSALDDIGIADPIVCIGPRRRGDEDLSYALPEPGRTAVIERLIEEAETC